jgi:23S rRNA maturation mini-RNase III
MEEQKEKLERIYQKLNEEEDNVLKNGMNQSFQNNIIISLNSL